MDVVGVYHYYPYGKLIENRTWEAEDARFGFQGQERDDEIAGAGNSLSTLFRQNSPLYGGWLSIDPLADKYPGISPYVSMGCNPIMFVDRLGDEINFPEVHDYNGTRSSGEISNDDEFAATRKAWLYAGAGGLFFAAVEVYGVEAVATFVAEEIAEECFENLTGMSPPPLDPFDFAQQGFKKAGKSFVADGTKQLEKRGNLVKGSKAKPYVKNRPSFRKGVVDRVWENAKDANGLVKDPNTGEILKWDKSKLRNGQWDMGHKRGQEYRKVHKKYMEGKMTKQEFLDWYNNPNNYRPEARSTNRGRRYEQP